MPRQFLHVQIAVATITLMTCSQPEKHEVVTEAGQSEDTLPGTDSLATLLQRLRTAEGHFVLANNGTWSFSGDDAQLSAFYPFGRKAAARLVDCIDDLGPAAVTLQGEHVPVGVLCALALQRMASPTEHEDATGDWPGAVLPTFTVEQLREAKRAWESVLRSGHYRIM